jgi:sugar/nucleoside kinase (ribokinase family)
LSAPGLLVAGSIALDTLEGPYGKITDELGGSALYFALAASLVAPVQVVGPVGADARPAVERVLAGRPVDIGGLRLLDAPTYRWSARSVAGRNQDLGNRDSIYDAWQPAPPAGFRGWAFAGSMRPDRQFQAIDGLRGAELLAADAMLSYTAAQPGFLPAILEAVNWFFCNHAEFQALGGEEPEAFRRRWDLRGLVLKDGPGGVTAHTADGAEHVGAVRGRPVVDTTGAGDTLAGGMLARWQVTGGARDGLRDALRWGVACASLAIEEVGLRGIARATPGVLAERLVEVPA